MSLPTPHHRVGILGGGQLARYLCAAGDHLCVHCMVLTPDATPPAAATAHGLVQAGLDDLAAVERLAAAVDVVTFELEAIPPATLDLLDDLVAAGTVAVHPEPRVLRLLQDKLQQKRWLVDHGLPTAPFHACAEDQDPASAAAWFGLPCVQKANRGGYDGQGVQVLRDAAALWPTPSYIEPFLADARELAVVVARGADGDIACHPAVDLLMDPRSNALDLVLAPSALPDAVHAEAVAVATRVVANLDAVGVFAVELFLTTDDALLINEISPRVHNAGHHTMDSAHTSQFEQHLRAVTGRPLGDPAQHSPAAMQNILLDPDDPRGAEPPAPATGVVLYWYDKTGVRPWRKLGHRTALGTSAAEAAGHLRGTAPADVG